MFTYYIVAACGAWRLAETIARVNFEEFRIIFFRA
jgi:hypothetical protein